MLGTGGRIGHYMSWSYKLGFLWLLCGHGDTTNALESDLMKLSFSKNIVLLFFYPLLLKKDVLGLLLESHGDVGLQLLHVDLLVA